MAVRKQNRNYVLTIQPDVSKERFIEVRPPFTLQIDIQRNTFGSANTSVIRIYNLSEKNRNEIRKNPAVELGKIMRCRLDAGYGDRNLATIFNGDVWQAFSTREETNMITQIESFDGGQAFNAAFIERQFPANTANRSVVENFVDSMSIFGIKKGAIGDVPGSIFRGNSYAGSAPELLKEISNGGFFIDNGFANVLGSNEVIKSPVLVISPETGLISTPVRQQAFIYLEMLFEPQIRVGTKVKLESTTESSLNTFYKVCSVAHRGILSESVGGSIITTVGLFNSKELTEVSLSE